MEHFATHKLSKTSTSLPSKVSDSIHCGSASWITNGSGTPIQHLQYMPYGEPFVNERTGSYEERSYSPLLHYHYVSTSLTVQIPNGNAIAKPQAFSCSPLLCYRFVTTTLTAQIPNGNAIANLLGSLHAETGFSYFGARYYDSDLMTG